MANIHDLPPELLFSIFQKLVLKSIIAVRGVCRLWRTSIISAIHPTRRKLLEFFLRMIDSPVFHASRPCILPSLQFFNREVYLSRLPSKTPDDFRTWLLEWPARAVFEWLWPGLPVTTPNQYEAFDVSLHGERNFLAGPPSVQRLRLKKPTNDASILSGGLSYDSDIWSEPADGLTETEVQVLRLSGFGKSLFGAEGDQFGLVVGPTGHESSAVIFWSKSHCAARRVAGDWTEFLGWMLTHQEDLWGEP